MLKFLAFADFHYEKMTFCTSVEDLENSNSLETVKNNLNSSDVVFNDSECRYNDIKEYRIIGLDINERIRTYITTKELTL